MEGRDETLREDGGPVGLPAWRPAAQPAPSRGRWQERRQPFTRRQVVEYRCAGAVWIAALVAGLVLHIGLAIVVEFVSATLF